MNIIDILFGRPVELDAAEEELGKPDEAEEYDLPLHVQRCAKRWALSYRASKHNAAQLAQIRYLLIGFMLVALFSPYWQKISSIFEVIK
jgi:hypothetical protein